MDFMAIGNNEPLPEDLPEPIKAILRTSRARMGFCDHGLYFDDCKDCLA